MVKLPKPTNKETLRAFLKDGFDINSRNGSHVTLKKEGFPLITLMDNNKIIKTGFLLSRIKLANMSRERLLELL